MFRSSRSFSRQILLVISSLLILLLSGLCHVEMAAAQHHPRAERPTYITLAADGDLEAILKGLLQQVERREKLKELLADPERLQELVKKLQVKKGEPPTLPRELEGLVDKNDPFLRKQVERLQNNFPLPQIPLLPKEKLEELRQQWENKLNEQKIMPPGESERPPDAPPADPPPDEPAPAEVPEPDDIWRGWLKDSLEWLEESELRELLTESPTFRQAVLDLEQLARQPPELDANHWPRLDQWFRELPLAGLEGWRPALPEFDLPRFHLPGLSWRLPSLPRLHMRLPQFGFPTGPRFPAGSSAQLEAPVIILLVLVLLGLTVWIVWQYRRTLAPPAGRKDWQLGPWPFDPNQIRTRGELVRAFDSLAVRLLGPAARHWNHCAVAQHLGTPPALQLAQIYEQARYAPEEEPLTADHLQQAQQCLLSLLGAAHI